MRSVDSCLVQSGLTSQVDLGLVGSITTFTHIQVPFGALLRPPSGKPLDQRQTLFSMLLLLHPPAVSPRDWLEPPVDVRWEVQYVAGGQRQQK